MLPWIAFALLELVSLGCLVLLWRQRASVVRRGLWTPVVLVPVLGPLFYAGLFDVPSPQSEVLQAPETSAADAGPDGP